MESSTTTPPSFLQRTRTTSTKRCCVSLATVVPAQQPQSSSSPPPFPLSSNLRRSKSTTKARTSITNSTVVLETGTLRKSRENKGISDTATTAIADTKTRQKTKENKEISTTIAVSDTRRKLQENHGNRSSSTRNSQAKLEEEKPGSLSTNATTETRKKLKENVEIVSATTSALTRRKPKENAETVTAARPTTDHVRTKPKESNEIHSTNVANVRRPKSKENRRNLLPHQQLPPPKSPELPRVKAATMFPSAWALSPGRSPVPASGPIEVKADEKKKRSGGVFRLFRIKKEQSVKDEEAHQMKMMVSRLLQWRFANAKAATSMAAVQGNAERKLFNAWLRLHELRSIVVAKRIIVRRKKHKLKALTILSPQINLLNQWGPLEKRNLEAVAAMEKVLGAICLSVPLVEGAKGNIGSMYGCMASATDTIKKIEENIKAFYLEVEVMSSLLSELTRIARLEIEGMDELLKTSRNISFLETHEMSLRAGMIQTSSELDTIANNSRYIL